MRVIYFSSNEYAMFAGVSITSMLKNNADVDDLEFYLLGDGISEENMNKLKSIFAEYKRKCEFIEVDPLFQRIRQKYSYYMRDYNGGKTGWLRFFPDEIFPEYDGAVLFMDSDTIINGSIGELCSLEWGDKVLAAANVPLIKVANLMVNLQSREEAEIIRKRKYKYFNAGIVIYNMKNFKKKNCRERMGQAISQMKEFRFIDQSVLNYTFGDDEVYDMGYKYNYIFHLEPKYSHYANWIKMQEGIDIESADWKPIIIHYPGQNGRPWFKESVSRLAYLFVQYRDISPWKGIELSYWDSSYYKNLNWMDKIKEWVIVKVYHTRIYGYYSYIKDSKKWNMAEKIKRENEG